MKLSVRIAIGAAALVAFLAATAITLRYWITSDGGRSFIVSQIDGRRVGPLGTIRLQGLSGDPLEAATLADIALVDDDGVWLRARDARIEWQPFKLLAGQLEIRKIDIRTVDVTRRPRSTYESERRPPPNIDIKLEEATINEFRIADGVFGAAASYKIGGGVARGRDGSGFLRIGVMPLTGPGDRLNANAEWSADGALNGEAQALGPVGGAIAGLLQAPEATVVTLNGNLSGSIQNFTGALRIAMADNPVAVLDVKRVGKAATLTAKIDVEHWPLLDVVARRTGGPLELAGTADLSDQKKSPTKIVLTAPAGLVEVSALVDYEAAAVDRPLHVRATGVDMARLAPDLTGQLDADGSATVNGLVDWAWQGDAAVANLTFPSGEARRVAGRFLVRQQGTAISWEAEDTTAEAARITSLKRMPASDYAVTSRGVFNLMTRIVDVNQAQVRGAPGVVSARGTYDVETGAIDFAGAASVDRLTDFAPLSGAARGQWTVKRSTKTAPLRITANATGRGVGSSIATLNQLLGPAPSVTVSAVSHRGHVLIESGQINGEAILASLSGRIEENGAISAAGQGRLRRPLTIGAAQIAALDFAGTFSGETSAPKISIGLSNGEFRVPGFVFTGLAGDIDANLGDRISGGMRLTGAASGQPLVLNARLAGRDDAWRLENVAAKVGGLDITAPQMSYAGGVFQTAFTASGSLAGLDGITAGTLSAKGDVRTGDGELAFKASGQANNLSRGGLRLQLVAFEGEAGSDRATVSGRVQGDVGAPVNVAYSAEGRRANTGGWAGTANLSGEVDKQPVATSQPIAWSWSEAGWSTAGVLSAFGGRLDIAVSDGDAGASSRVEVADVDLRALTRIARINPINGRVSGRSTFSNTAAGATADMTVSVKDANPAGVTADPVSLDLTAQLRNARLMAAATGKGQGFELSARGQAPFEVGAGFNVAPSRDGQVAAAIGLRGRAEQLWALFGPEGHSLRGALDADVQVAGTLASPTLEGGFEVAQGVYEQADTGLRLRDIAAKGQFDQRSVRVLQITANDGEGGTVTGDANINWQNGLDGGGNFNVTNLRALGRDDRFAIVSGTGEVALEAEAIRIKGAMTVAQARFSIEQPAAATIPVLPTVRRINFRNQAEETLRDEKAKQSRPIVLDLDVDADRRIVVFGRGLDSEWSADIHVGGTTAAPLIEGQARLVRGDLSLAGRRFDLDSGTIRLDGPISAARVDISASRDAEDIDARVRVTGSPDDLEFKLESTPTLPQDEILARVIFGRSASQLSGLEAAQLAAGLTQLAGGNSAFDPAGLIRQATGLDRVSIGGTGGLASVSAGKYIANDVYVQVGAGGKGGVGAEVEWEPADNVSIISSAQGNGDTKIAVRWKKDY